MSLFSVRLRSFFFYY